MKFYLVSIEELTEEVDHTINHCKEINDLYMYYFAAEKEDKYAVVNLELFGGNTRFTVDLDDNNVSDPIYYYFNSLKMLTETVELVDDYYRIILKQVRE